MPCLLMLDSHPGHQRRGGNGVDEPSKFRTVDKPNMKTSYVGSKCAVCRPEELTTSTVRALRRASGRRLFTQRMPGVSSGVHTSFNVVCIPPLLFRPYFPLPRAPKVGDFDDAIAGGMKLNRLYFWGPTRYGCVCDVFFCYFFFLRLFRYILCREMLD